jgi:hypothetical protein
MYTTDEAIDFGLTKMWLDRALLKHDSSVPDSIGDRLFRMALKLSYCFSYESKEKALATLKDVKELLQSLLKLV